MGGLLHLVQQEGAWAGCRLKLRDNIIWGDKAFVKLWSDTIEA